jgi:septation ring formation regulator EzrA
MSDDKATIAKRLDRLAELLEGVPVFIPMLKSDEPTIREAIATINRQAAQIAMLRNVLAKTRRELLAAHTGRIYDEYAETMRSVAIDKAEEALAATAEDVEAWEKSKRGAVLEEASQAYESIRASLDTTINQVKALTASRDHYKAECDELREKLRVSERGCVVYRQLWAEKVKMLEMVEKLAASELADARGALQQVRLHIAGETLPPK